MPPHEQRTNDAGAASYGARSARIDDLAITATPNMTGIPTPFEVRVGYLLA